MVLHLVPGNPAQVIAGPDAPPETVRQIEVELGLDKPQPEQYAIYLGRVVLGRHVLLNMGGYGQYGTPVHRHGPAYVRVPDPGDFVTVIAFNLLGDALRDRFDPTLKD